MKAASIVTLLVLVGAAACGGPQVTDLGASATATPTPSGTPDPAATPGLSDGTYDYTLDTITANTCWAPSKNMPTVPMSMQSTVTVSGANVTVSSTSVVGNPETWNMTLNGLALTGTAESDADLSSQGIDCVMHVASTFTGTVTGANVFTATQHIDLSAKSGSQCSLLVGTLDPRQFDQMPCSLDFDSSGQKQ